MLLLYMYSIYTKLDLQILSDEIYNFCELFIIHFPITMSMLHS